MHDYDIRKQIQSISEALEASNQALFSRIHMIFAGIGILLIPVIEWLFLRILNLPLWQAYTQILSLNIALHIVFYWAIFYLIHRLSDSLSGQKTVLIGHPLIQKAFDVHKPITYSIIGIAIAFGVMNYTQLIFPMVFIFFGILFNLYGRFSTKIIYFISWTYILVGLAGILASRSEIHNLWIIGTSYFGVSYILMGYFNKNKLSNRE